MTSLSQFAVTATTLSNTQLRKYIEVLYEELFSRLEEPESGTSPAPVEEEVEDSNKSAVRTFRVSGYILFSNENRQAVKDANPDIQLFTEIGKKLGRMWGKLDKADKEKWNAKAAKQNGDVPTVCTVLPSAWSCTSSYDTVHHTLQGWQPAKTDKYELAHQLNILLGVVENTRGVACKTNIVRYIFQLLAANTWFMEEQENFRLTVRDKIRELECDPKKEAKDIAAEFAWMKQYPFPPVEERDVVKCAYCGKAGSWTIDDGGDLFCTKEHRSTFSANGDCAHTDITKEELDHELECTYCGKPGCWTIKGGSDYFCTEEHRSTFSANGDCAHTDVTKEELDRELDDYREEGEFVILPRRLIGADPLWGIPDIERIAAQVPLPDDSDDDIPELVSVVD